MAWIKENVYVMTCWIGFRDEDTGELEIDLDLTTEYTAATPEELEKKWRSFQEGEDAGVYGYYGEEPAYFISHEISDNPEEREFWKKSKVNTLR